MGRLRRVKESSHMQSNTVGTRQMRRLDSLTASQAATLLAALAVEEAGLGPAKASGILHCSSRNHPHMNGTPSLQVRSSRDQMDTLLGLKCHGRCGVSVRRLSEYLSLVGPVGAAARFWTKEKVDSVLGAFERSDVPELHWNSWKQQHGLPAGGVTADKALLTKVSSSGVIQTGERFAARYDSAFLNVDALRLAEQPRLIANVCRVRGYNPDIVSRLIEERLLALMPVPNEPENALIRFAYRGLFDNAPGRHAGLLKDKILVKKPDDPTASGFSHDPAHARDPIGDFSFSDVFYSEAPRVAFWEGEPDCVAYLHYHPKDANVCLGQNWMYRKMAEHIDLLSLTGRRVLIGVDRDEKDGVLAVDVEKRFGPLLTAIRAAKPSSISIWMCPRIPGRPSKDLNDFLLAYGWDTPIEPYQISLPLEQPKSHKSDERLFISAFKAHSDLAPRALPL